MQGLLHALRLIRILRTEILLVGFGTVVLVEGLRHLLPGVTHSLGLDVAVLVMLAVLVTLYDVLTHQHKDDFAYHIDHDRLERACHLKHDAQSREAESKTPGQEPGVSHHHVHRKFSGRE